MKPGNHSIKGSIKNKILYNCNNEKNINQDKPFLKIPFLNNLIIKKCGNSIEDDEILNLIYTPTNSYNSDDTIVLFSNGVYFVFNYPEYDNIIKSESNPYNREIFDFKYISSFSLLSVRTWAYFICLLLNYYINMVRLYFFFTLLYLHNVSAKMLVQHIFIVYKTALLLISVSMLVRRLKVHTIDLLNWRVKKFNPI